MTQEDLSRLGRNTIDTGYYIEQYFRIRNIRFIAVNENFDTAAPEDAHSGNVILPMLMEGTFDCVISGGQDSNYRDPQGFMQFIYDEGKWDNEEFLSLVEKAHMQTGDERIQTWMDVEKMVLDNFIYIPQVYAENHWVTQTGIRGLMMKNYGYEFDFKHVWIAK